MEMNQKGNTFDFDRISELPEPILHHILKFLPFKEIARACVLSTRWEHVWYTYPVFIIDFLSDYINWKKNPEKRVRAIDCLEETLRNRLSKDLIGMEKLEIRMELFGHKDAVFVEKCLGYAIASNVRRLVLVIRCYNNTKYDLPSAVLCVNSLEVLELLGYITRLPKINIKFPSLKKLDMRYVDLNGNGIESVLVGCPSLEELRLVQCSGLSTLQFFGHEKLKYIDIFSLYLERVEIDLKNLNSFLVGQPTTYQRFVINMNNCTNLKKLELNGAVIKANRLSNIISRLLLLEYLSLKFCDVGKELKISSTSLNRLEISTWGRLEVNPNYEVCVALEIDSPHLSFFHYSGDLMISICSNAMDLSRIDLNFRARKAIEEYVKLAQLLKEIHGCSEKLILNNFDLVDEVFLAAEELRKTLPSPLFSCPYIEIVLTPYTILIARVMDELLWMFPHMKTLSFYYGALHFTCKFSYKKPLIYEGEYISCCKSIPLLCWEQCIDKVEVELGHHVWSNGCHSTVEEQYCLEGAKFQEKIDGLCNLNM